MRLQNTRDLSRGGINLLVYGQAGAGKTSLIPTLPAPIIISTEGGLLSIQDSNLPYIEISTIDDLREVYKWLGASNEAAQYQSVAVDSLSEVAEVVLAAEMKKTKDGRQAYGELGIVMTTLIRSFRDLPRHVYMTAKMEKSQDETGKILYSPAMPGKSLSQQLPYFFDEVFALRIEKDAAGSPQRMLLCDSDGLFQAKDRSGKLDQWENPDLGAIINKIGGSCGA